jgi:uncharacterized protein YigE (DUF2233 family)
LNPWHITGDKIVLGQFEQVIKAKLSWDALVALQIAGGRWEVETIAGETATYLATAFDPIQNVITFTREPAEELEGWLKE